MGIKTTMIVYEKLWQTMKMRNISQYALYTRHNVSRSQIQRLRKNQNVQISTIDKLCNILQCGVGDILEHVHDDSVF